MSTPYEAGAPATLRVLGIDPGLRLTGYACLEAGSDASAWGGSVRLIEAGVLRFAPGRSVSQRLVELDHDLGELLGRHAPAVVAVEKLYSHWKHPLTAILMGHARGVVLLGARRSGAELAEVGATAVKKSLTGRGHASKQQMQDAVMSQLRLTHRPEPADVADAIAIALCAARRHGLAAALGGGSQEPVKRAAAATR